MDTVTVIGVVATVIAAVFAYPAFRDSYWKEPISRNTAKDLIEVVHVERKIVVGCVHFLPFTSFVRLKGRRCTVEGLHVEMFKAISKRANITVEFLPIRASEMMPALKSGSVHVVATLMETTLRVQVGEFIPSDIGVPVIGVARSKDRDKMSTDFLRKETTRIAAVRGEIGEDIATRRYNATRANGRLITLDTEDVPSIFGQVLLGNADVALTTGPRLNGFDLSASCELEKGITGVFLGSPLALIPCGVMIPRGNPGFRKWLEHEMTKQMASEWYRQSRCRLLSEYGSLVAEM